jgi:carotenoid cleavage dioxygenase-like enzyme
MKSNAELSCLSKLSKNFFWSCQLLVAGRKDGTGAPIILKRSAGMVFHHGNLIETGDRKTVDSLISPDDSILRHTAACWTSNPPKAQPHLTRFTLDLKQKQVVGRSVLGEGQEFPRFDTRMAGMAARHLYTLQVEKTLPCKR